MTEFIRLRQASIFFLASGMLLCADRGRAQDSQPEYKFKAAYLHHFAQFVEWPTNAFATATSPLVIAVLGQNSFGDELERAFRDKTINGHPLVVKTIGNATEARTNCHLLFISSSEGKRLPADISALGGASVLTVGETDNFNEAGGMIRFLKLDNKIRFQINDDAAKRAGLTIRAKLLSLSVKPPG